MRIGAMALCMAIVLSGCMAVQRAKGQMTVVDRSANKPGWVEQRSWDKDGQVFFVGTIQDVKDLSLGEEQAEYQAKKVIASSIQESFQREFSTARTGNNRGDASSRIGESLESALAASTNRVRVRGVLPVERYWERIEVSTDDGARTAYNVALLVRVSMDDLNRARRDVLEGVGAAEQVKADSNAKALIQEVKARLGN